MKPREEWQLPTRRLGRRVLVYDRVDSTNTLVAAFAHDPTNDGLALLADEQTAGRGQYGRTWQCPPCAGVMLSLLLFPPVTLRRPVLLTAWTAVSVCETIRRAVNLQAGIKWPNDVLLHGRKVCGILIEASGGQPPAQQTTIVGIGLNLNQPAEHFAAAGLTEATSLAILTGQSFDRDGTARLLLQQLDEEYNRLCQGDLITLEASWKGRLGLVGKQVTVECPHGVRTGRLRHLSWDGLELEQADGAVLQLRPESVRHLTPA